MTAYIGTADLRAATKVWPDLEIPGSSSAAVTDANVSAAIDAATSLVSAYCGDDFYGGTAATTHLIYGPPNDTYGHTAPTLFLDRRFWYGSVTKIETRDEDDVYATIDTGLYRPGGSLNATGTDLQPGDSYDAIDLLSTGSWAEGTLNLRVTAKWGWSSPPMPVKRACALLVYDWLSGKNAGLHRAISWQTSNMSFTQAEDAFMGIPELSQLLDPYVFGHSNFAVI